MLLFIVLKLYSLPEKTTQKVILLHLSMCIVHVFSVSTLNYILFSPIYWNNLVKVIVHLNEISDFELPNWKKA